MGLVISGCFLTPNLPPTAQILADVVEGQLPLLVQFDGTTSKDEDGIVRSFHWAFGDGMTSETMRPTYTYSNPGVYTVTLIVTDNDSASASASITIVVTEPNSAPIALFTATPSAVVPQEVVAFDATGSLDGDGWITTYQWDFGDGATAKGATVEHQYAASGTYPVTLTVVDNDDTPSTFQAQMLVIDTNQAPVPQASVSASAIDPGDTLICSSEGSIDPDGEIVSYEWDFGDGTRATGGSASHVYGKQGTYRITLTATDDQGARQSTDCIITVGTPTDPAPPPPAEPPADTITRSYRWSYGGTRSLSLSIPESLIASYQSLSRDVWATDGYKRFVLDPLDDALMIELRSKLMLNNSYQATIENALAFVQNCVTYQLDPGGTEYPRYPAETLVDGVGDCEDSAILYASIVRTFGYSAGVLLMSVDTNDDQVMDHIAVLVRVADCFVAAHPERSLWVISGKTYAFAETALSGGYLSLGIDPWGIEQEDIHDIWDVANPTNRLQATRRLP